jgi:Xaa-Pro aminopeptidase
VLNKDQIEGLRAAAKIAAATLKHALENTKVSIIIPLNHLDRNET